MHAQSFEGNEEAYQLVKAEAKTHSFKVSLRDWMVASENIYAELGQNVDEESFILFADEAIPKTTKLCGDPKFHYHSF